MLHSAICKDLWNSINYVPNYISIIHYNTFQNDLFIFMIIIKIITFIINSTEIMLPPTLVDLN